ncbi:hypothetical protein [Phytohabitans kaempferiae]|uniref:Uncharacterized protein n=1 Tax=Phytohabitans kaempferiae TaxID=1620943 RepID=A0ABV6MG02_9ACTN
MSSPWLETSGGVSTPLPGYPGGLLVVHDGQNTPDVDGRPNTNFKYLDAGLLRRS